MAKNTPIHIVIVGAGFSGAMVATHLLTMLRAAGNQSHAHKITLINRPSVAGKSEPPETQGLAGGLARGLAYGTQSDAHLLNVPAGRMSAFPDQPDDFLDFLHRANIVADGGSFVARKHYGEYLRHTLDTAVTRKRPQDTFATRHAEVVGLTLLKTAAEQGVTLTFTSGETLHADFVVLALGNFIPANLSVLPTWLNTSPQYVRDPWAPQALSSVDLTRPVLCIGTGLTMLDVALALDQRTSQENAAQEDTTKEETTLRIHALSRHGLLPQPHRDHTHAPTFAHAPAALRDTSHAATHASAHAYLRAVREEIARLAPSGIDWRDVIASLRPITAMLWQRLPVHERQRFLRHLRAVWDVHRHRAAPQIAKYIDSLAVSGKLLSNAARILSFEKSASDIVVRYRLRGEDNIRTLWVGSVINCTGPSSDITAEPLMQQLARDGLITRDPLGLGIDVGADLRVQERIFYVGPLLKARDWEATAVPELREYAAQCAAEIIATMN
jgi:uncharacterized NAD(P)/FAD-binding protein YdhS